MLKLNYKIQFNGINKHIWRHKVLNIHFIKKNSKIWQIYINNKQLIMIRSANKILIFTKIINL
jgi:hypothetical protein